MFNDKFKAVLTHEGVISITSWDDSKEVTTPHVNCTWNSFVKIKDEQTLLIPAAGMSHTEADLAQNNVLILTLGSRDVEGFNGGQGTGFRITGTGHFIAEGEIFTTMKAEYPFIRKVLCVTVTDCQQLL